jgi:hypothetical protein
LISEFDISTPFSQGRFGMRRKRRAEQPDPPPDRPESLAARAVHDVASRLPIKCGKGLEFRGFKS